MEITIKLEPRETEALATTIAAIIALGSGGNSWKDCPALHKVEGETHTVSMGGIMNFKDLPEEIQEVLKSQMGNLGGSAPKNKK